MTALNMEIGHRITDALSNRLGDDRFELWFDEQSGLQFDGKQVVVFAPDQFTVDRLKSQFQHDVSEVVQAITGPATRVVYQVRHLDPAVSSEQDNETNARQTSLCSNPSQSQTPVLNLVTSDSGEARMHYSSKQDAGNRKNSVLNSALNRNSNHQFSLNNFVFGSANPILDTAIHQFLRKPQNFSPFVIYGTVGCGKTHLLNSITSKLKSLRQINRGICVSAETFTSHFVEALNGRGLPVFRRKYRDLDLLAIDDVQFFKGKPATLVEFQQTIDSLLRSGKQILVSADRHVAELEFLAPELIARLCSGLACGIDYPCQSGRAELLERQLKMRQIELSEEVITMIAAHLPNDVRQLQGAVNKLHAASLSGAEFSVGSAKRLLHDVFQANQRIVSIDSIEQAVCDVCGVQSDELKSNRRTKRVSTARMLAMWLARKYTHTAYSEIGQYYGGRSHSTVISAQKKINGLMKSNQEIALSSVSNCSINEAIKRIENQIMVG